MLAVLSLTSSTEAQLKKNTPSGTCTSDLDCVLLGSCVNGRCVCDPGFTGPNCQEFDLMPSKTPNIEGFDNSQYPAWGGKAVYYGGKWHWIGTYIREGCEIWDYNTNSAFLRATGDHPMGPFTFSNVIFPPFHHGAHVEVGNDGKFHLFGDGRVMPESTVRKNCRTSGKGPSGNRGRLLEDDSANEMTQERRDLQSVNLYPRGNSPNDVHFVATANTPDGPWDAFELKDLQTNVNEWDRWSCNKTNLAPVILKNNTVVMAYRSKACTDMQKQIKDQCGSYCQKIAIAVSHNGVRGPYELRPTNIAELAGNEDPYMWHSKRGWHMVLHGKNVCGSSQAAIDTCGSYGYSLDSYTWYLSPFPIYGGRVDFDPSTGKKSETLYLRHRPKMLFDHDGTPLVLYNSGQRFNNHYTRNFAFAFNVPQMVNFRNPPDCPSKESIDTCTHHTRRNIVYERTEPGCQMMGAENCIWCPSKKLCMPGTDDRVCSVEDPKTLWTHCT